MFTASMMRARAQLPVFLLKDKIKDKDVNEDKSKIDRVSEYS